jgi:hydrogenase expression/formation protein HypC
MRTGKVSFGGIVKEVILAYVPEAQTGDYVLVHVGFAISTLDEAEAQPVFEYLRQAGGAPHVPRRSDGGSPVGHRGHQSRG